MANRDRVSYNKLCAMGTHRILYCVLWRKWKRNLYRQRERERERDEVGIYSGPDLVNPLEEGSHTEKRKEKSRDEMKLGYKVKSFLFLDSTIDPTKASLCISPLSSIFYNSPPSQVRLKVYVSNYYNIYYKLFFTIRAVMRTIAVNIICFYFDETFKAWINKRRS
jgi:hypothetical protein